MCNSDLCAATAIREQLLESLRLSVSIGSSQLKALDLAIIGAVYHATQNEQAEKMYSAVYMLSQKSKNEIGCLVASTALKSKFFFNVVLMSMQAIFFYRRILNSPEYLIPNTAIYANQGQDDKAAKQVSLGDAHYVEAEKMLNSGIMPSSGTGSVVLG